MSWLIRPALASDARQLAALATQVWLDTYALDGIEPALADYVLSEFTPQQFVGMAADPTRRLFVAVEGKALLGYIHLLLDSPCPAGMGGRLEVGTLYVSRHWHGRGIGRGLLDAAKAAAATLGESALWLKAWHRNEAALAFYDALGWQRIGETDFVLDGQAHKNWLWMMPTGQ
jgi:ribosomal protein S18 acetylase RimI-like enzyme